MLCLSRCVKRSLSLSLGDSFFLEANLKNTCSKKKSNMCSAIQNALEISLEQEKNSGNALFD